jgi:hypothetical protein
MSELADAGMARRPVGARSKAIGPTPRRRTALAHDDGDNGDGDKPAARAPKVFISGSRQFSRGLYHARAAPDKFRVRSAALINADVSAPEPSEAATAAIADAASVLA